MAVRQRWRTAMASDQFLLRNAYVGSPVERIEDLRFLRGRGKYVDDLTMEGLLHAVVLRIPVVHGIITAADIANVVPNIPLRLWPLPQLGPFEQPVIAQTKVRYVGEPVAVVVADSAAIAEDACDQIELDIETLEPVTSCAVAATGKSLLHESHGSNLSITYAPRKGDAEAAFKDAPYLRRERFSVQRHMALTMETRGLLAAWDAEKGKLVVSGAAKVPFFVRRTLASLIGLPEDAVDLIENDVGGGFGARGEFFPEDFLIPFAAKFLS